MKKIIYTAKKFGYVGSEVFNHYDERIMMKCVKINAHQASIAIGELVSFRIIDI